MLEMNLPSVPGFSETAIPLFNLLGLLLLTLICQLKINVQSFSVQETVENEFHFPVVLRNEEH